MSTASTTALPFLRVELASLLSHVRPPSFTCPLDCWFAVGAERVPSVFAGQAQGYRAKAAARHAKRVAAPERRRKRHTSCSSAERWQSPPLPHRAWLPPGMHNAGLNSLGRSADHCRTLRCSHACKVAVHCLNHRASPARTRSAPPDVSSVPFVGSGPLRVSSRVRVGARAER